MDDTEIKQLIGTAVQLIGLLDVEELRDHIQLVTMNNRRFDELGPLLDPTGWIKANKTKEFELAKAHLEIAKHILAIREKMDEAEALRLEYIAAVGQPNVSHD